MAQRRHIPDRKCVACGQKSAKRELVRVVRTPQGTVLVDETGKSAGRGAYLCRKAACWRQGLQSKRLEKSLSVTISPDDQAQLLAFYQETIV